ncbi:glycosyltransferase [Synechococcus sp. MU1643]|uniref:glycosyltransferase family 2 protein n=1 Tax=Synechococcus sp. MU1643 TaxID=2508349 RepID=UPI001CF83F08|nr:glycosyltransferase family 2 protein [Synechococcus sp. MU1643]MCB4429076.1 glycosyltransferase [Synechococcus sp. MU1643]
MTQENPTTEADLSLVLCTYGRTNEVDSFLNSIYMQTKKPAEIIIVDQNEEDILHNILKKWSSKLPIMHNRVNFKGASKSRNYGAKKAVFSLIAFPDDDCLYPPRLIENIIRLFQIKAEVDTVITAKIEPSEINGSLSEPSLSHSQVNSTLDLFKAKAETSNIFTKKSELEKLSYIFSENIGPGANTPWASNEETDLLIRLLKQETIIIKLKELSIAHHSLQVSPVRSLKYGMGRFEVISKHQLGVGIYLINLLQPIARYLKTPKLYNLMLCLSTMLGRSGILNQVYKILNARHNY